MARWPHLKDAPITEALVDIQVELPPNADFELLETVYDALKSTYPHRTKRLKYEGEIKLSPQGSSPSESTISSGPYGLVLKSTDNKDVMQARVDGFTLSRLEEYQDWNHLIKRAKSDWRTYAGIVEPNRITRIAVRYINRIRLPLPVNSLSHWFALHVVTPPFSESGPQSFLLRLIKKVDDSGSTVVINLLNVEQRKDEVGQYLPIVLDIDVFRKVDLTPETVEVWSALDELRELKNDVFFQSVTTKLIQSFGPRWEE